MSGTPFDDGKGIQTSGWVSTSDVDILRRRAGILTGRDIWDI
jgi:hypothetical protein